MNRIKRDIQDLERFTEILEIIVEEESGYILDVLDLEDHLPVVKQLTAKRQTKPGPERLRETIEELGTTFIKFGQIMAERPDIVPPEYAKELEKLQDSAPSFSSEKAKEIVEEEIGLDSFEKFEEEPIAAASVAQVHRATLENGDEVVVKIRRPGVKEQVEQDLDILRYMVKKAEKHSEMLSDVRASKLIREFCRWTRNELDLKKEMKNAQIFKSNIEDLDKIYAPDVYPALTTEKVLVLEYIEGVKATESDRIADMDLTNEELARTAVRAGMKQTIGDGFFHADPHPSNFFIQENGRFVYLDFGMMGEIPKDLRDKMALLLIYTLNEDSKKALKILQDIGHAEDDANLERIEEELNYKIMRLKNSSIGETSISKELLDLIVVAGRNGLHLPTSMTLMGKNLLTMEGIGLAICPDFEPTEQYKEYGKELLRKNNSPERLKDEFMLDLYENREMVSRPFSKMEEVIENKQQKTEVKVQQSEHSFLPTALILSSALIIGVSTINQDLLYLGIFQFLAGLYLEYRSR